jgi:hypothetical protein
MPTGQTRRAHLAASLMGLALLSVAPDRRKASFDKVLPSSICKVGETLLWAKRKTR